MLSSKLMKNGLLRILDDLDGARRGKKRDKERRRDNEDGGTGREEGRGGRRDKDTEKMKKLLKK